MTKKLIATILALVLALSVVGCSTNEGTENILSVGDRELGAGIYIGYMLDYYTNAGYQVMEDSIWDGVIGEESVEDYIRNNALTSVKRHIAVDMMYEEMGLALTEEEDALIERDIENLKSYTGDYYYKNGCGDESLYQLIALEYKLNEMFIELYYEDGTEAVSDDEKTEYYEENYAEYRVMTFYYRDINNVPLEDDAKDEVNEIAEGYYERAQGDEDFDELAVEATEDMAAYIGAEDSYTEYDTENSYKLIKPDNTSNEEGLVEAIFDADELVTEIYYGENAVYVFQKNSLDRDETLRDSLEADIIASLRSEEFETKLDEYEATLEIVMNEAAVDRYSPRNIDPNV